MNCCECCFFFQAEDGIRDLVRSRGLGDVYKRQIPEILTNINDHAENFGQYKPPEDEIEGIIEDYTYLSLIHI